MRNIKFRARSTNTGSWVYGYFTYDWDSDGDLKPCIQSEYKNGDTSFTKTIVDPNTLCQFTGCRDKITKKIPSGNDIYEGDYINLEITPS